MRRPVSIALAGIAIAALAACVVFRPDKAIRVATGLTSHTLCSAAFVSGLDPDGVYAEVLKPTPGLRQLDWALRTTVDRAQRTVRTTWLGAFESQALFRDRLGCIVIRSDGAHAETPYRSRAAAGDLGTVPAEVTDPPLVEPKDARLSAALDRAFAERARPPYRGTKAVVVVHDGQIIAERYAAGYGIDTPVLGWSMTKSVVNALIGVLVREGRVTVDGPAPVPEWQGAGDPRHAITIDQLLRMTSGLALDERYTGFDSATRMLYLESDMAAFAQSAGLKAPPGSQWQYTGGNTLILSRIIRDAVGGDAMDVLHFAQRELFDPLGMHTVTLEFDAAGTPVGASYMYASARDWARFGMLYLNDGVVGSRRILPEGWVRYSTTPTLGRGYGAGWWINRAMSDLANNPMRQGLPSDSFHAQGALGQRLVVIPSERLVVVRLGVAQDRPRFDLDGMVRLVADVMAALHARS